MKTADSELVLHEDGSVYHLRLKPEHIADHVILVGDPGRVSMVSSFFDEITFRQSNREFTTHTGFYKGKHITALSTGIGTDNIDIVVNELDAAVNYDLATRTIKKDLRKLNLIRIGTSGALQVDLEPDTPVLTQISVGLDGVKHFYDIESTSEEQAITEGFHKHMRIPSPMNNPYAVSCSEMLRKKMLSLGPSGITLCANGFFGPQGRALRIPLAMPSFNDTASTFTYGDVKVLNYEMESSALYSLGKALGHECLCICVVVANRKAMKFSTDYQSALHHTIESVLDKL